MLYALFSEHFSNGKAAHSEKKFDDAKQCYDKAREAMERLLSQQGSDQLVKEYAELLTQLSVVELQLGNIKAAKSAVEKSLQCNPTAEVCTYLCTYLFIVLG